MSSDKRYREPTKYYVKCASPSNAFQIIGIVDVPSSDDYIVRLCHLYCHTFQVTAEQNVLLAYAKLQ